MPIHEEKCFPRGGKKPLGEKPKKFSEDSRRKSWLVSSTSVATPKERVTTPKKNAATPRKRVTISEKLNATSEQLEVADPKGVKRISLPVLAEGNITIGYVREVNPVELKINLPGLAFGYVPAANISEEYCSYLKGLLSGVAEELQELTDMFKPGQLVVARIEKISTETENAKVILSLVPKIINRFVNVRGLTEGLLLSASVHSNEDRAYVMNCGIYGVKATLRKDRALNYEKIWNNGKPLGVGHVLRCLITKCTTSEASANVELTVDPEKLSECVVEKSYIQLNSGILGKCFQLSVQKVFPTGLVVKFTRHQYGYVHSSHLNVDFDKMKENSVLSGRVLYIDPGNENIFFTALKTACGPHPPPPPFQEFERGSKISKAKIITKNGGNLLLEMSENSNYYGLVCKNHLNIGENIQTDDIMKERYYPGSIHECKVLDFDYMCQKYICTFNRSIIKQKFTSLEDLYPGLVAKCTIQSSTDRRITLKLCDIKGFVGPLHFSDKPHVDAHTLFTTGQEVKAKVLAVKNPACEFTLKPALVNSRNPILTEFSDARYDVEYEGVIVLVNDYGVLVKFYADFTTFVNAKYVYRGDWNLKTLYYVGQVVKCQVSKICVLEQKLILEVRPFETKRIKKGSSPLFPLQIGKLYTVIVKESKPEGLIVQEEVGGVMGRIPATQLTDSPHISSLLCGSYKTGDKLQALCLNGEDEVMFTASPTFKKYFESSVGKMLTESGLSGLQEGLVVPSIVTEISSYRLVLSLPMFEKTCSVFVRSKNVCGGKVQDIQSLGIQMNQTLMVRILRIDGMVFEGSLKLELVLDKSAMCEHGLMLLQDFMLSQKRIHTFWKKYGHPLGELEIGSQVEGTVAAVTTLGAVVNLDNGIRAVVMPIHIDKDLNLEVNMHVKGTVMYFDIVNQCVEITLWKHLHKRFSSLEKVLTVGKHKKGFVYISRPDVLVCTVQCLKSSSIVYVPSRWHINDLRPKPFFPVGARELLTIAKCRNGMVFAVPRKVEIHERKYRKNKIDADIAKEDASWEEIPSSEEEENGKSLDEGNTSEECPDFTSLEMDICSNKIQTSVNDTVINIKQVKKGEQEENHGFDESSNLRESADYPQCDKNISDSHVNNKNKNEQKKKKKRKSFEKSVNEIEMKEDSTASLSNEQLIDVEMKTKKQKKNSLNDTSLVLDESSQIVEEYLDHESVIENAKPEKKKKKKNSLKRVNHSETEGFIIEENDVSKIEGTCDQRNDHLIVGNKSKKQKKKSANHESLCLSTNMSHLEENLYEPDINNENKIQKRKRKKDLEESVNQIESLEESIVSENGKKSSSRSEIEEIGDNLQLPSVNESFKNKDVTEKTKNKKRKRETLINKCLCPDESTDLSNLVEEYHSESVINKNASKTKIKKEKKTDRFLSNHQNKVQNSLGSIISLKNEVKNEEEGEKSCLDNKEYEKEEKKETSSKISQNKKQPSFLNVCAGFFWNATPDQLPAVNKSKNADVDSSSEEETEVMMNKKKKQRLTMAEKRELARQEEERLRKVEERLMNAERNPVSADDFDRLIISAPNNSQNWIKYMAYHLEATEVGKARAVAERALKTISFREEQEKMNVWMALLNLENLYGTKESLEKTLEEAVKMNDSYKIHMQVLNMYSMTKKLEELDKMVQLVTKKYKHEVKTWVDAGLACMKCGEIAKSRQLMQRALTVLDKKYHVEVLTRFARMENEWGESERAETLMENILTSYPKRIDVWSVYIDMLVKSKKFDLARQVLERAVIQKLPVSKMKFLFKKYLAFEQAHGTPDRVEKIREMAKNFVENLKSDIA